MNTARKITLLLRLHAVKAIVAETSHVEPNESDEMFEALEAVLLEVARIAHPEGV